MSDSIEHVHAESVRIGIRLAALNFTGTRLPEDKIAQILRTLPVSFMADEFPLSTLTKQHHDLSRARRDCAQRLLEVMLHHAGEAALLSSDESQGLVGKAWRMAMAMEEQEQGQAVLDQLESRK